SALADYRAHYDAWNNDDEEAYFGDYANPITCYYNESSYDRRKLWSSSRGKHFRDHDGNKLQIGSLKILGQRPGMVLLRDQGTYTNASGTHKHDKIIGLVKASVGWKIAIEVSR